MTAGVDGFKKIWMLPGVVVIVALVAAVCVPNLLRSRIAAEASRAAAFRRYNTVALKTASLDLGDQIGGRAATEIDERKTIRNGSLDLVVKSPTDSAEQIRALAEGVGGFLVSSQTAGGPEAANGSQREAERGARAD